MAGVTVTYSPRSKPCMDAVPSFNGAVVRRDALEVHGSCDGVYRGGPVGPFGDGDPCMCPCHSPEGLPEWMRPQEGAAFEAAVETEERIRRLTAELKARYPVLPAGPLADVAAGLDLP